MVFALLARRSANGGSLWQTFSSRKVDVTLPATPRIQYSPGISFSPTPWTLGRAQIYCAPSRTAVDGEQLGPSLVRRERAINMYGQRAPASLSLPPARQGSTPARTWPISKGLSLRSSRPQPLAGYRSDDPGHRFGSPRSATPDHGVLLNVSLSADATGTRRQKTGAVLV